MDGSGKLRLEIPSPLKKGDFIHYEGQEYQIIKFLGESFHDDEDGVIYRVRDTRTNNVVNITLPFDIVEPIPGEDFFQILDLNEDNGEVTLKSMLTRGEERNMKVRWDEDLELIRNGLKEVDKELFYTLKEVMGKEFIGDFKFMLKDPPIMKMPNEDHDKKITSKKKT